MHKNTLPNLFPDVCRTFSDGCPGDPELQELLNDSVNASLNHPAGKTEVGGDELGTAGEYLPRYSAAGFLTGTGSNERGSKGGLKFLRFVREFHTRLTILASTERMCGAQVFNSSPTKMRKEDHQNRG